MTEIRNSKIKQLKEMNLLHFCRRSAYRRYNRVAGQQQIIHFEEHTRTHLALIGRHNCKLAIGINEERTENKMLGR